MGAWIETQASAISKPRTWSHPTWVRGLKRNLTTKELQLLHVAPYMGAWIETNLMRVNPAEREVAPYMGAWIETPFGAYHCWARCRTLHGCVD